MFWFRVVVQITISLAMSALSGLLLEQRWKTGIELTVSAAAAIVILSIAIVVADRILGRLLRKK